MLKTALAVALGAAAHALIFPPFGWQALSWLVLVPLLLATRERRPAAAAAFAALYATVACLVIVGWLAPTLRGHFERSLATSVGFLVLVGVFSASPFYAAAFALLAAVRPHLSRLAMLLLFPAAWVAAEYARTHVGLESPWGKLGDAHHASPRLRLVAELGGVYAVSFVVAFGNAVAAEAIAVGWRRWHGRPAPLRPALVGAACFAVLCAAALGYGESRRLGDDHPATLDVMIVQGNLPPELRWRRASANKVVRRYVGLTRGALRAGPAPDLVVWPENALQTSPTDRSVAGAVRMAAGGIPLVLGAPRFDVSDGTRRHFNSAWLLRPDAEPLHYDKRRLLPFSETRGLGGLPTLGARGDLDAAEYTPGDRPGLFALGDETLGLLICFEAIYPEMAREAVRGGARVLVNLSNDGWYRGRGGARQHLAQAVFRAIENGVPLVRATSTGVSAAVAPDGRVLAEIPENVSAAVRVTLPAARAEPTLYTRVGDAFSLGCLGLCLGALAWAGVREAAGRRVPSGEPAWAGGDPAP